MGEMGCFPSRGVPGHWKGAVCRHQPHGGWRRVSPGGSSRRGSSSPLGGSYYPRRTPSPPAGRTGTAPHTRRPPGPAPLPEAKQPRRGAGAQTARRVGAAPSCPPPRGLLSVDSGLSDCPAALRNGRGSRWPRRAELFLGRCKRRRAEPLRRGPGSTLSGRARSDASRLLARLSRGPRAEPGEPGSGLGATETAGLGRRGRAAPPSTVGRASRLLLHPRGPRSSGRPPPSAPERGCSPRGPRALGNFERRPCGGRARRARRGSPAGARPRAERAAPPSVC